MNNNQIISKDDFRKLRDSEINSENRYLSAWHPIDDIEDEDVGSIRPWTREGQKSHGFGHDFYATLVWYKDWKIRRFEQSAWNLDDAIKNKISKHFSILISEALNEVDEGSIDTERSIDVKEYLKNYDTTFISQYTAVDYLFQNITNRKINNVVDFGSGIARQSMQWDEDVNFYSIDAVESLYLLQNKIYSKLFPNRLKEYFADPSGFAKIDHSKNKNTLYHMPTWRMDLIPDNSIDLIICVQVLNEIDEKTVRHVIGQFKRIAKKDCVLYVRDHEAHYSPGLKIRVGRVLLEHGFEVVFRYNGFSSDLEGVPRVWANTGYKSTLKKRVLRGISYPNTDGIFYFKPFFKSILYKLRDIGLPI